MATDLQWVVVSIFLQLNLFLGRSRNCFPGKPDETVTAKVQYTHGNTFCELSFQGLSEAINFLRHNE